MEATERALVVARQASEEQVAQFDAERRRLEEKVREVTGNGELLRQQFEQSEGTLRQLRDQLEAHRSRAETVDQEKKQGENEAREQASAAAATIRRHEMEAERVRSALEDTKASVQQEVLKNQEAQSAAEVRLKQLRDQMETHRSRAETLEREKKQVEADSREQAAAADTKIRRLEMEAVRVQRTVEEGKVAVAQKQAAMTAKIADLERQIAKEADAAKAAEAARRTAETQHQKHDERANQLMERASMSSEELFTRQVEFVLEKQRLSGALEESRRTLRHNLGVPTAASTVDTMRISGLEKHLAEERRKSIEQAVALQRAERRCNQLEEAQKRGEEQRSAAVQQARDAERRCLVFAEDLRKSQLQRVASDQKREETRERAAMAAAENHTIRFEAGYDSAKLRGALDELRFMIKMHEPVQR